MIPQPSSLLFLWRRISAFPCKHARPAPAFMRALLSLHLGNQRISRLAREDGQHRKWAVPLNFQIITNQSALPSFTPSHEVLMHLSVYCSLILLRSICKAFKISSLSLCSFPAVQSSFWDEAGSINMLFLSPRLSVFQLEEWNKTCCFIIERQQSILARCWVGNADFSDVCVTEPTKQPLGEQWDFSQPNYTEMGSFCSPRQEEAWGPSGTAAGHSIRPGCAMQQEETCQTALLFPGY